MKKFFISLIIVSSCLWARGFWDDVIDDMGKTNTKTLVDYLMVLTRHESKVFLDEKARMNALGDILLLGGPKGFDYSRTATEFEEKIIHSSMDVYAEFFAAIHAPVMVESFLKTAELEKTQTREDYIKSKIQNVVYTFEDLIRNNWVTHAEAVNGIAIPDPSKIGGYFERVKKSLGERTSKEALLLEIIEICESSCVEKKDPNVFEVDGKHFTLKRGQVPKTTTEEKTPAEDEFFDREGSVILIQREIKNSSGTEEVKDSGKDDDLLELSDDDECLEDLSESEESDENPK